MWYPRFEYIKEIDQEMLNRTFLTLVMFDGVIKLDSYHVQSRPSKRHKWRDDTKWKRLDRRNNTMEPGKVPYEAVELFKQHIVDKMEFEEHE